MCSRACPFKFCSKSVVFADSLPFLQGTFCNITLFAPDQHCTLWPWAHIHPLLLQLLRKTLHLVRACILEIQWNLSIAEPLYRWHTETFSIFASEVITQRYRKLAAVEHLTKNDRQMHQLFTFVLSHSNVLSRLYLYTFIPLCRTGTDGYICIKISIAMATEISPHISEPLWETRKPR